MHKSNIVSIFEAKTHLSGLVDDIMKNDKEFIITRHGQQVAKIVPMRKKAARDIKEVIAAIQKLGESMKDSHVTLEEIQEWRNEGRR